MTNLREIRPNSERAKETRRTLIKGLRVLLTGLGDDFAGYAVVLWDGRGLSSTLMSTSRGPIGDSMLPSYARDVLNRHVIQTRIKDDDSVPEDIT